MPSEKLTLTIANIADVQLLTGLSEITFRETFGHNNRREDMDKYIAEEMNLEKLSSELRDKQNLFLLAGYGDKTAGYMKISTGEKPAELKSRNPLEIARIYVLKEYQNKKIGAALLQHCMDHAINNDHDVVWLGVWEHNINAIRFYKRLGFEEFGSHIFRLGDDDQTDLLMKRELV